MSTVSCQRAYVAADRHVTSRHSYTASLETLACDAFLYMAHGGGEINCRLFNDAMSGVVAVYCRMIRNDIVSNINLNHKTVSVYLHWQFVTRNLCLMIAVRHAACLSVSVQVLETGADMPLLLVNVHAYTLRCM
jgi:hypothetical protein